jgi:hypothetical protein
MFVLCDNWHMHKTYVAETYTGFTRNFIHQLGNLVPFLKHLISTILAGLTHLCVFAWVNVFVSYEL